MAVMRHQGRGCGGGYAGGGPREDARTRKWYRRFARAVGMLPLTGTSSAEHMQQDLASLALPLSEQEVGAIESLAG